MEQVATLTLPQKQARPKTQPPQLWNVVLLDDDSHSYDYVIEMTQRLFGHPIERAFQIAKKVDSDGRAILRTCHRELAELKVDQIRAYGRDVLVASSVGSMRALIEPADTPGGGEGD